MKTKSALLVILCYIFFAPSLLAGEREEIDSFPPPSPQYVWPDTNFVNIAFGFPSTPTSQVMANGHIYVAFGGYLGIYRVEPDGRLTETCLKMMTQRMRSIEHNGEHLFVEGEDGLQIYEGTNYQDPQLVGGCRLELGQFITKFSVYGDSLYCFFYQDGLADCRLGIMDVSNLANPQYTEYPNVVGDSYSAPQKRGNYLYVSRERLSGSEYFSVFDLSQPSQGPVEVDTFTVNPSGGLQIFSIVENAMILVYGTELHLLEFTGLPKPVHRATVRKPCVLKDVSVVTEGSNKYGYFTGISVEISWLYKIGLTDLANPITTDSIFSPGGTNFYLIEIDQGAGISYVMASRSDGDSEHQGVHAISWTAPEGQEIVQSVEHFDHCLRVLLNGDIAYAATENGKIAVVDCSNHAAPRVVLPQSPDLWGYRLAISGSLLVTALGENTVRGFSLADPLHPQMLWEYSAPEDFILSRIGLYGQALFYSFIPQNLINGGLMVLDMSDPDNPRTIFNQLFDYQLVNFSISYPHALLLDQSRNWVRVYDISDLENIHWRSNVRANTSDIVQVLPYGGNRLLVNGTWAEQIWDVSNWTYPVILEERQTFGHIMQVEGGRVFATRYGEVRGVYGLYVWEADQTPLLPDPYQGFLYYSSGMNGDDFLVDYPYVFIPGGANGLLIAEFTGATGIAEENPPCPKMTAIITAHPNPFNGAVSIGIEGTGGDPSARLEIYDILGRLVRGFELPSGTANLIWDARDFRGEEVSSGVYFARYRDESRSETAKLVLLR